MCKSSTPGAHHETAAALCKITLGSRGTEGRTHVIKSGRRDQGRGRAHGMNARHAPAGRGRESLAGRLERDAARCGPQGPVDRGRHRAVLVCPLRRIRSANTAAPRRLCHPLHMQDRRMERRCNRRSFRSAPWEGRACASASAPACARRSAQRCAVASILEPPDSRWQDRGRCERVPGPPFIARLPFLCFCSFAWICRQFRAKISKDCANLVF